MRRSDPPPGPPGRDRADSMGEPNLPDQTGALRPTSSFGAGGNKDSGSCVKPQTALSGFTGAGRDSVMHNLVVCGAKNPNSLADGAMFSDFMGISMTLRNFQPDSNGTFLSYFPLDQHFDTLEARKPPITDIKWGRIGPNAQPMYTYSRAKWMTRQDKWFEFVDAGDLLTRIVKWMHDKAATAKPGDSVNLFFQCHGTPSGALCLGIMQFDKDEFTQILRLFGQDVRVNAVGSHCYSGQLVQAVSADGQLDRYISSACGPNELHYAASRSVSNRHRNMRFSQYFVQSVAKPELLSQEEQPAQQTTVASHDQLMTDAMRNITPTNIGAKPSTYTSYLSPDKVAAFTLLEDLLVRENADVAYNRESNYRRKRTEWPCLDLTLLNRIRREKPKPQHPQVTASIKGMVQAACAACNSYSPYYEDGNVFGELEQSEPDYESLMKVLYWRSRQQVAVWEIFTILCDRHFLDYETSLAEPIDFSTSSDAIGTVFRYLSCFDFVIREQELSPEPFKNWQSTYAPLIWLAIAIARGCAEPEKLFELIQFTGILGCLRWDKLNIFLDGNSSKHFTCEPKAAAGKHFQFYGFWLPHGIGHDWNQFRNRIKECLEEPTKVEELFKRYFELSDSELRVVSYAQSG